MRLKPVFWHLRLLCMRFIMYMRVKGLRIINLKGVGNDHCNKKLLFYVPFKNQVLHNVNQSLSIVGIVVNAK